MEYPDNTLIYPVTQFKKRFTKYIFFIRLFTNKNNYTNNSIYDSYVFFFRCKYLVDDICMIPVENYAVLK